MQVQTTKTACQCPRCGSGMVIENFPISFFNPESGVDFKDHFVKVCEECDYEASDLENPSEWEASL